MHSGIRHRRNPVAAPFHRLGLQRSNRCRSLFALAVCYIARHSPAMRIMACRLRSTSLSVVAQEDTLIRIAVFPCQTVPPHQQVPSSWTRRITSRVTSGRPKDTSTWLITTSFSTSKPVARSPCANRCAWAHVRSISSHNPALPSDFNAAHNSTPRARRDAPALGSRAGCGLLGRVEAPRPRTRGHGRCCRRRAGLRKRDRGGRCQGRQAGRA